MNTPRILSALTGSLLATGLAHAQVVLEQLDDFEGNVSICSQDNWTEGLSTPNPPIAQPSCGVADSCCLENDSAGGFGPGSRQSMFNETQWTGNYLSAGVNKIQLQIANPGATLLNMRFGISNGSTCYVSTHAEPIATGAPLAPYSFLLDESTMTEVPGNICGGGASLADVLANVSHVRFISAAEPRWEGDAIVSTVRIDAVQAKADSDLDGVDDDTDNCTDVANADQRDTDADGYGNSCDADLNNDCTVNFIDLGVMASVFFTGDPDADLDGNGTVNFLDLNRLKAQFFGEPGPGLGVCGACKPPEAIGTNTDFAGLDMFVRGGLVGDWGAEVGHNNLSDQSGGVYVARFELSAGDYEYKIADAGWSLEYCTVTNLVSETPTNLPLFGCAFPVNGTISIPASDCYEFTMTTDGSVPPDAVNLRFESAP